MDKKITGSMVKEKTAINFKRKLLWKSCGVETLYAAQIFCVGFHPSQGEAAAP